MESVVLASIIEIVEKNITISNQGRILIRFIADGTFQNVQRSKPIQKLDLVPVYPRVYVATVDMGMIWLVPTPTREDQEKADATACTQRYFATKIINLDISRHQLAAKWMPCSIKDDKRDKEQSNSAIPGVLPKMKDKILCFRL